LDKILLIGAGGHARSCIDVLEGVGRFEIVGIVEKKNFQQKLCLGYPIIGNDDDLVMLGEQYQNALITIGQIKSPKIRVDLFKLLKKIGFILPTIYSLSSYVSRYSQIGEGSIIHHGAIINVNVNIGYNCIINSKSLVEHDVLIGNNCHIATGAIINGGVTIGNGTFIGSGTIIKESIVIGDNCLIGSGVTLKKNVESNNNIYE
jgi:sugar O-acyltransferase (sialic acid O-acetyltransferase NeuD family)